jgi:hypothetical protein
LDVAFDELAPLLLLLLLLLLLPPPLLLLMPLATWMAPTSKCMQRYSPTIAITAKQAQFNTYLPIDLLSN